jgi:pantoate--beta-alanine ligase
MVAPDVAFFGQKDAQQVAVVRRMVADLDIPVTVRALPIVREPDGLAMSSRNRLLSPDGRSRAIAMPAALAAARRLLARGEGSVDALLAGAREAMRAHGVEPEYVELVDPATFEPLDALVEEGLLVLAARVEDVRLIDNELLLRTAPVPHDVPEEALPCSA